MLYDKAIRADAFSLNSRLVLTFSALPMQMPRSALQSPSVTIQQNLCSFQIFN